MKEHYKLIPLFGLKPLAQRLKAKNAYQKLQHLFMGIPLYIDKPFIDEVISELEAEHQKTIQYLKAYKKTIK